MAADSIHYPGETWEQVDDLLERVVVEGQRTTTTRYRFKPGGRFSRHRHSQEQVTYVIGGDFRFTIDGIEHRLEGDSLAVVPPDVIHSGEAGPDGADIIAIVAPARRGAPIEMLEED